MNRGAKFLVASLSVATTISGWAWLTLQQSSADAQATDDTAYITELPAPTEMPLLVLNGVGAYELAPLPTPNVPDLAKLPVRGLRIVSDPTAVIPVPTDVPPTEPPSSNEPPKKERNTNNAPQVSAPPQQPAPRASQPQPPAPQPKPKPQRKTKSSK
jgi:hypothetical protein